MTGTVNGTSGTGVSGQGRQPVPRTRRVEFTLSGEEYAILVEAAGRAGMARRAYAAQAALTAAANGSTVSGQEPLALALTELMRAAGLVRRIATNLNQAAGEAERHRAARREPARLRGPEHPPRRPYRPGSRRRAQSPAAGFAVTTVTA